MGRLGLGLALLVVLGACAEKTAQPKISPTPSSISPTTPIPAAQACPKVTGGEESFAQLTEVRAGAHEAFDRVTFEFRLVQGSKIPTYEMESATAPFAEDASGEPIDVDGEFFARIVFHGATGYDVEEERETYTGPEELKPLGEVLVEVQRTGDFEATLSWVFGLSRPSCWTVNELSDPSRLVINFSTGSTGSS